MKTLRSLVLFSALAGTVLLNSCSKKSSPAPVPANSITVNIDGVATSFNVSAKAITATSSGLTLTSFTGSSASGAEIALTLASTLVAGKTYSDNAANSADQPLFEYSNGADDYLGDDAVSASIPTITITGLSSTLVQGTFSGHLTTLVIGNTPAKTTTFTGGKFNLSL